MCPILTSDAASTDSETSELLASCQQRYNLQQTVIDDLTPLISREQASEFAQRCATLPTSINLAKLDSFTFICLMDDAIALEAYLTASRFIVEEKHLLKALFICRLNILAYLAQNYPSLFKPSLVTTVIRHSFDWQALQFLDQTLKFSASEYKQEQHNLLTEASLVGNLNAFCYLVGQGATLRKIGAYSVPRVEFDSIPAIPLEQTLKYMIDERSDGKKQQPNLDTLHLLLATAPVGAIEYLLTKVTPTTTSVDIARCNPDTRVLTKVQQQIHGTHEQANPVTTLTLQPHWLHQGQQQSLSGLWSSGWSSGLSSLSWGGSA